MTDTLYTNGVIAVKEKQLLGEKLLRFPEMTVQEVFRALSECGFGGDGQDAEALCRAEEGVLDAFIREYAPTKAELAYLLAPRDFHNAKALCKAKRLNKDAEAMLASEGLIPVSTLAAVIYDGAQKPLAKELSQAIELALSQEEIGGAQIGAIFDAALQRYLLSELKHRKLFKNLLIQKADMTNLLTLFRSATPEQAQALFLPCGKLSETQLLSLFADTGCEICKGTDYESFVELCRKAKEKHLPFTEAERALESFEAEYFHKRRFELEGKEPFLYYVFRRRTEIQNVRMILVCLNAGLAATEIKKRLR